MPLVVASVAESATWFRREWKLLTGKKCPSPLIHITESLNILVEELQLINAPGFHIKIDASRHVEVRAVDIYVDRAVQRLLLAQSRKSLPTSLVSVTGKPGYPPQNPAWLNTDGIDPAGADFHIHHCSSESTSIITCLCECVYLFV
jgi:hypothetical protein